MDRKSGSFEADVGRMAMHRDIRVLVVDDSAVMRRAIQRMLDGADGMTVVGVAKDGEDAIEQAARFNPDVVTLDVEMPILDGLSALPRLKQVCDARIIMVSSLCTKGASVTRNALSKGASDCVTKAAMNPANAAIDLEDELIGKIRALGQRPASDDAAPEASRPATTLKAAPARADAVVIASSTGGPPILETIVQALTEPLPGPIIIAQHMPSAFTSSLAARLDQSTPIRVVHATSGTVVEPDAVYVLEGGIHAEVRQQTGDTTVIRASSTLSDCPFKPSADVLFETALERWPGAVAAVVLTGMGNDGAAGAKAISESGGPVVSQNEASCSVFGMPRSAIDAVPNALVRTPDQIGPWINELRPARRARAA